MRGKGSGAGLQCGAAGITPAYAGKSDKHRRARSWLGDHPRVCGEKSLIHHSVTVNEGSPPRMRGKATKKGCSCPGVRITPAYAGKSLCVLDLVAVVGDHPRVCGEKCVKSSDRRNFFRITPAYAGKRLLLLLRAKPYQDHPRVCGEKHNRSLRPVPVVGSPPRMRGKDCTGQRTHRVNGITPAYAGKSGENGHRSHNQRDHPRVCGEKKSQESHIGAVLGSPPRMRGKV